MSTTHAELEVRDAMRLRLYRAWEPIVDSRVGYPDWDVAQEQTTMWEAVKRIAPDSEITFERFVELDQISTGADWYSKLTLRVADELTLPKEYHE